MKPGFRRCIRGKQRNCRLCPYTKLAPGEIQDSVTFEHSGEVIPIKTIIDCQSSNILYKLDCTKCPIPYLGESNQTAEQRLVGHLNTIKLDCLRETSAPVGRHFRDTPGHSHSDLSFTPFEKIQSKDPFIRKAQERHLINKHQLLDYGLNLRLWSTLKFSMWLISNWFSLYTCLRRDFFKFAISNHFFKNLFLFRNTWWCKCYFCEINCTTEEIKMMKSS